MTRQFTGWAIGLLAAGIGAAAAEPPPRPVVYLDRSWYSTETQAVLTVDWGGAPAGGIGRLAVTRAGGDRLADADAAVPCVRLPFALAPFEGRACLRVRTHKIRQNGWAFLCVPQHTHATPYVWSVYLKADRPGMSVRLADERGYFGKRDAALTTAWQRVSMAGTVPARCGRNVLSVTALPGPAADWTFWADAVQVEAGETPTAFEP